MLMLVVAVAMTGAVTATRCGNKTKAENTPPPPAAEDTTFKNPVLTSGPDPWVAQKDGYYYYMHTLATRIAIWKTKRMSQLSRAQITTIWSPAAGAPHSKNIWAPELHFLNGKWYVYYTAGESDISTQRIYVLENAAADPTQGTWTEKGKIYDNTADFYAIDGTVLEGYNGHNYFIWSGHPSAQDNKQCIYISRMSDPWTLETPRVMLSAPQYEWETRGAPPTVNEGPEIIKNGQGRVFLVYSASACWTDDYALGMLSLKEGGDPLNPADWTKDAQPVFVKNPDGGAYGPGHNGFFKSPDGKEDWILYHANSLPGQGCRDDRNPRIQRFTWRQDGTPDFGTPAKINVPIAVPSGE